MHGNMIPTLPHHQISSVKDSRRILMVDVEAVIGEIFAPLRRVEEPNLAIVNPGSPGSAAVDPNVTYCDVTYCDVSLPLPCAIGDLFRYCAIPSCYAAQPRRHYAVYTGRNAALTLWLTLHWLRHPSFSTSCAVREGETGCRDSRY